MKSFALARLICKNPREILTEIKLIKTKNTPKEDVNIRPEYKYLGMIDSTFSNWYTGKIKSIQEKEMLNFLKFHMTSFSSHYRLRAVTRIYHTVSGCI